MALNLNLTKNLTAFICLLELLIMRDKLWKWAVGKHPEGIILTRRLLAIRAILYPLDSFYWRMSESRGYQWESDTWNIYGVRYTGAALRALAEAQGETYRITKTGNCVTLERVDAQRRKSPVN